MFQLNIINVYVIQYNNIIIWRNICTKAFKKETVLYLYKLCCCFPMLHMSRVSFTKSWEYKLFREINPSIIVVF